MNPSTAKSDFTGWRRSNDKAPMKDELTMFFPEGGIPRPLRTEEVYENVTNLKDDGYCSTGFRDCPKSLSTGTPTVVSK